MDAWLKAALNYMSPWIGYRMQRLDHPGCAFAVAHKGRVVLDQAFGVADLATGKKLTPRHRHRVASHSKSFTGAGIMKLREKGRLRLDDPVGRYVEGLDSEVADATLMQLLSHSAGIIRDGVDAGQWHDRRPFLNDAELRAALAEPPVIEGSLRFKYSNHGFGLLGLVIQAVTGEPYVDWTGRHVVAASRLGETQPDGPLVGRVPQASGHSGKLPVGNRVVIPGNHATNALAPATGFASTAGDLAKFFASLDPAAKRSILTPASRREMIRRQWYDESGQRENHYGLGVMVGKLGDWDWFGHGGAFPGYISRTLALPGRDLAVSVITNAVDGSAGFWADGLVHILRGFAQGGAPKAKTRDWSGRWWCLWGAIDLVPFADHVAIVGPHFFNPFEDTAEIEVTGRDQGRIRKDGGYCSHGETARLERAPNGKVRAVWLSGTKLLPERRAAAEMKRKYET